MIRELDNSKDAFGGEISKQASAHINQEPYLISSISDSNPESFGRLSIGSEVAGSNPARDKAIDALI